MTYDDLLTRLDARAGGRAEGAAIAARLRARYDVVLVDEFQDTDPVQWDIMRRAFGEGERTLVLIADPKQAIYAFRGADVYAYLEAAARPPSAARRSTINWRSDQGLIDAYDALLADAKLGHEGIVYRRVRAADAHRDSAAARRASRRTTAHPGGRRASSVDQTFAGFAQVSSTREHIAADLAGDVVDAAVVGAPSSRSAPRTATTARREWSARATSRCWCGPTGRPRRSARRSNEPAFPAVINGAGSVFATDDRERVAAAARGARAADVDHPRAHRGAHLLSRLVAPSGLRRPTSRRWEDVHARLHDWARVLRAAGVASLTDDHDADRGLPRAVLADVDGERRLTDLRHIGQLLHAAASSEQLGVDRTDGLAAAADRRGERRHGRRGAKPAAGVRRAGRAGADDPPQQGTRVPGRVPPVPVGPGVHPTATSRCSSTTRGERPADARRRARGRRFQSTREQYIGEQRGEDLRLAYVALTRARHQAVVWWAGSEDAANSPLGRLLFARTRRQRRHLWHVHPPAMRRRSTRFQELAAEAPGCVSVERSVLGIPSRWSPPLPTPRSSRPPRSSARSTSAGGGPPTPTSPRARTTPSSQARPRSRSSATSRPSPLPRR